MNRNRSLEMDQAGFLSRESVVESSDGSCPGKLQSLQSFSVGLLRLCLDVLTERILAVVLKLWVCGPYFGAHTVAISAAAALKLSIIATFDLTSTDKRTVRIELYAAA